MNWVPSNSVIEHRTPIALKRYRFVARSTFAFVNEFGVDGHRGAVPGEAVGRGPHVGDPVEPPRRHQHGEGLRLGVGIKLREFLFDYAYGGFGDFGATLHISDAGRALLSALALPSGIYNVCRDGERVSTERFTRAAGWHPQQ